MTCSIIIVTYNSERVLPKAMEALLKQTRPADQMVIVDSGSNDPSYLSLYNKNATVIIAEKDIGFCRANNIGYKYAIGDYVFLVNPDLFLTPDYLEKAMAFMEQHPHCGALTGTTLGYDIHADHPSGRYDSTGIFSTWYGRWYDRGQGERHDPGRFQQREEIPAICGAVFFCRKAALDQVLLRGQEILDATFYMYKEDIDLSLRLRRHGWSLLFIPSLVAYHCRGWSPDRRSMPRWCRLVSAKNEWRIHWQASAPHKILYSTLKWACVRWLNL